MGQLRQMKGPAQPMGMVQGPPQPMVIVHGTLQPMEWYMYHHHTIFHRRHMIHNNQEWEKDYPLIHIQTGMKDRHKPHQLLAPAQSEPGNHELPKWK